MYLLNGGGGGEDILGDNPDPHNFPVSGSLSLAMISAPDPLTYTDPLSFIPFSSQAGTDSNPGVLARHPQ